MSMLYATFTVLPSILQCLNYLHELPSKEMIINMHKLMCLLLWWPDLSTDGTDAFNFVHGRGKTEYHRLLHKLARNFVKSCDLFANKFPNLRSLIDRPNSHRLLELTAHTIPLYSHLYFICELVFEATHQPLKFFLSRNHTASSHLHAVHMILARDWLIRINAFWTMYNASNETQRTKDFAMLGLMRLFCGEEVDSFSWTSALLRDDRHEISKHIETIMKDRIEERLKEWYADTLVNYTERLEWRAHQSVCDGVLEPTQANFLQNTIRDLAKLTNVSPSSFGLVLGASLQKGASLSTCSHERIGHGDVIQLLTSSPGHCRFVDTNESGAGQNEFFVVGGLIKTTCGEVWLVLKRCENNMNACGQMPDFSTSLIIQTEIPPFYTSSLISQPVCFTLLNGYVRKVGVLHNCTKQGGCSFCPKSKTVKHSTTTLKGGHFIILSRSLAYPPRRS